MTPALLLAVVAFVGFVRLHVKNRRLAVALAASRYLHATCPNHCHAPEKGHNGHEPA